ncbi:hypothetical protein M1146_05675 [Patescibacteria group bacterium]|nr:hypothetical protein [Patescibacteria group bacterium]
MANLGEHTGSPLQLMTLIFVGTNPRVCPSPNILLAEQLNFMLGLLA